MGLQTNLAKIKRNTVYWFFCWHDQIKLVILEKQVEGFGLTLAYKEF